MGNLLTITVGQHEHWTIVEPVGEIDLATAADLDSAISELLDAHILVSMEKISFIDSSGLRVLAAAHARATDAGRHFALVAPSPVVQRVLSITAFDQLIDTYEALDDVSRSPLIN